MANSFNKMIDEKVIKRGKTSMLNLRLAPLHIKSMFVRAGYSDAPKVLAPGLYAAVMLKDLIGKIERKRSGQEAGRGK